jgi:hypothetical protein
MSKNTSQMPDLSTVENKLEKLCDSISLLNETLREGLISTPKILSDS